MADAEALSAATSGTTATRWGLVLNERGAVRALAAGLRHLQMVVSVSDTHSRHNAGRSTEAAVDDVRSIATLAAAEGAVVEVTLATAFGCPYEHEIAPARVVEVGSACADAGVAGLGLADTIGVAVPTEVAPLVRSVGEATGLPIGAHLHDTRGLGLANALAAIDAGAMRLDGGLGGLGGCPFAPGASGNLPLEDLVHALDAMGIETGVSVDGLLDAAALACATVGRPVGSHVGIAGPRFRTTAT
jgi:hydroxymethylglutaryl-CoA lyase